MVDEKPNDATIPLLNNDVTDETSLADDSTSQKGQVHVEEPINGNTKPSKTTGKNFQKVNLIRLFSFADKWDIMLLILGLITAIMRGFILPWLFYLMGSLGGLFSQEIYNRCLAASTAICPFGIDLTVDNYDRYQGMCKINSTLVQDLTSPASFQISVRNLIIEILGLASVQFVATFINYIAVVISSERQTNRMRQALFRLMLNKNLTYFDTNPSTEWYIKLSSNIDRIAIGIGDKLSSFISAILVPLFGIVICLCIYWPLALILGLWVLIGVFSIIWLSKIMGRVTIQEMRAYSKAGSVAQQALSALRTVLANNAIGYILQRYASHLDYVGEYTVQKGSMFGMTQSVIKLMQFFMNLFGLGGLLLLFRYLSPDELPSNSAILQILCVAALCPSFLIQAGTYSISVIEAQGAAVDVFAMLDEDQSTNDNVKDEDKHLLTKASFQRIEFDHVTFSYPARPQVRALDDVSFGVERGNSVALVGHSGSGKSSCVQLLTRLYEVNSGNILLDGVPLTDYDREWLRLHTALVSQETNIFSTTIYNNIQYGNINSTKEDVIEAAKQANAHSFIMKLPNKYETLIGERGGNLSGGERQRIVLARALIRHSPILLLDEPTSALDSRSEQLLQQALDRACKGRLTLIIAHRLSTIRHCSCIYVMDHGKIVEFGNHEELMARRGVYFNLSKVQQREKVSGDELHGSTADDDNQDNERLQTDISDVLSPYNDDIDTKKSPIKHPFFTLLKLARPEFVYIAIGSIICFIYGTFDVIYSIVMGFVAEVLQECDIAERRLHTKIICLMCLIMGVVAFFVGLFVHINFSVVAAVFVKRLRIRALAAYLRQEIGWHDQEVNNSAALCTRLSTDCDDVKRLVHMRIVFVLQTLSTLVCGSILGFYAVWQLMLIVLVMIIVYALTIAAIIYLTENHMNDKTRTLQKASMLSVECISNIRTVHQLGKNEDFSRDYNTLINSTTMKKSTLCYLAFFAGIQRSIARFTTAALYYAGVQLVNNGELELMKMNVVFGYASYISLITSLIEMTVAEISRSGQASHNFVELFQRKSLIDSVSLAGREMRSLDGRINYDKVSFSYPTRPHIKVLDQLSMEVTPGKRIALIGPSGCGKSSTIQLLARFYDVNKGRLLIDGIDIRSLNVHWWRSQIALVNQDPVLFDGTIRDNILFGCQYRVESLPNMEQIIEAAKGAKIHDFICSLPDGYDTSVGSFGTQVSGGQKQRIVIARCLLRQAKFLLFDEATSAMDTVNEQLIQQALEEAHVTQNSTTIIVAHRLSTIRQCDVIFVLNNRGQIIESGSHETLIALDGVYHRMISASSV